MPIPDVLVIGGGVIGAACARELARRGLAVTIVDDHRRAGIATTTSAGMLAPLVETTPENPLLGLAVRGRDFYRELTPALREETGIDIGLRTDGILHVAFTPEEAADVRARVAWQRQSGFAAEWIEGAELEQRVPGINPEALGAAVALEDGALDPAALHRALLRSAELHGARLRRGEEVEELTIRNGRVQAAKTTRRAERGSRAGAFVLAAGCWSGRVRGLPRPLTVEPVRGQMVALPWPEDIPPAVVFGPGGYVLERAGDALAGSTMEHAGFDPSVTQEGIAHVRQVAERLFPALRGAPIRRQWAGLRPATPDGQPLLGPDPTVPNLWYATGHGRNGILLAGITGALLAALFTGEPIETDLSPMDPARLWQR